MSINFANIAYGNYVIEVLLLLICNESIIYVNIDMYVLVL